MYTLWLLPSRTNLNLALSIYSQVKNNTRQPELSAKDKVRQCYKRLLREKYFPKEDQVDKPHLLSLNLALPILTVLEGEVGRGLSSSMQ